MSFREKSAWIQLLSVLLVYGYYFVRVLPNGKPDAGLFLVCVFVLVAVQIVAHAAVAIPRPKEANARADERERSIAQRALVPAYYVAKLGMMAVLVMMLFSPERWASLHHLFLVLVLSTVVRLAMQIHLTRLAH